MRDIVIVGGGFAGWYRVSDTFRPYSASTSAGKFPQRKWRVSDKQRLYYLPLKVQLSVECDV